MDVEVVSMGLGRCCRGAAEHAKRTEMRRPFFVPALVAALVAVPAARGQPILFVANQGNLVTHNRNEGIKQPNKVKKLLLRLKGFGGRHPPLLGFMLAVDLLDLTPIDTQTTRW